jgi:hypothetical protein
MQKALGRLAERRAIVSAQIREPNDSLAQFGSVLPIAIVMDNRVVGRWGSVSAAHAGQRPVGSRRSSPACATSDRGELRPASVDGVGARISIG